MDKNVRMFLSKRCPLLQLFALRFISVLGFLPAFLSSFPYCSRSLLSVSSFLCSLAVFCSPFPLSRFFSRILLSYVGGNKESIYLFLCSFSRILLSVSSFSVLLGAFCSPFSLSLIFTLCTPLHLSLI